MPGFFYVLDKLKLWLQSSSYKSHLQHDIIGSHDVMLSWSNDTISHVYNRIIIC